MSEQTHNTRVTQLNEHSYSGGTISYWMSRDQRVQDNWALLAAQEQALKNNHELRVLFTLQNSFLKANKKHFSFMLHGLEKIEKDLKERNIHFEILLGKPEEKIPEFINTHKIGALYTDFSPLKISRKWKNSVAKKITIPFYEVDAHNIVPCWVASQKQEFAAYTFRPKITKLLPEYLSDFPKLKNHSSNKNVKNQNNWENIYSYVGISKQKDNYDWIQPGEKEALKALQLFLTQKFEKYDENRNDPTFNATSNLSPYLHFGHISAQRVSYETRKNELNAESTKRFLEELIVRKELSDNYCYYNNNYDSFEGFPEWARNSLNEHKNDKREFIYDLESFENAKTHDELWNAAQQEMLKKGKMHGYMRMYWAKKILEWTATPEQAQKMAIYLNDKYELDGRDPNGYTGIAWSIGGVHDRPWFERPVYGKIRYMNYNGAKRKFDVAKYIENVSKL